MARMHRKRRSHKRRKGRGVAEALSLAKDLAPHALSIGKSGKAAYDLIKKTGNPFKKSAATTGSGRHRRKRSHRKSRKSYHRKRGRGLFGRSARVEARVNKRSGSGVPYRAGRVTKKRRRAC